MTSTVERGSIKKLQVDRWSARERLCLASAVSRSGDQNWMSVSRSLRMFGEPNRPPDWFSQKNCAVQYSMLLENVETPKRKKRSEKGEVHVETPSERILRKLTTERIEELKRMMQEKRAAYLRLKEEVMQVKLGHADDRLQEILKEIQEEKKQKENKAEAHEQWLREREEKKLEMERNWKSVPSQSPLHRKRGGLSRSIGGRRNSSQSEHSSEADSPISEPSNADTSRLQQAIANRGSSPTITSLLSSSPAVPTTVSSGLKKLVSSALSAAAGSSEHPVPISTSPSAGAPTLSMLLELPPSLPGKPLPELPVTASKAVLPPAIADDKLDHSCQETPSLSTNIKDSENDSLVPIEPKIEPVEDIVPIEPKEEPVEEELIEEEDLQTVIKKEIIDEYTSDCEPVEPIIRVKVDSDEDNSVHEDASSLIRTTLASDIVSNVKAEVENGETVNKIDHITGSAEEIVLDKDFDMIIEGTMQELTDDGDSKTEVADLGEVVEFDEGTEVKEAIPPDLADMEVIILGKVNDEVAHVAEEAKLLETVVERDETTRENVCSNTPNKRPPIPSSNEAETAKESKCTIAPVMELQDANISQSTQCDEIVDDDDHHHHHHQHEHKCIEDICSSSVDSSVTEGLSVKKESENGVQVTIKEDNLHEKFDFFAHTSCTNSPDSRTNEDSLQESRPVKSKHRTHTSLNTSNDNVKVTKEITDSEESVADKLGSDHKFEVTNNKMGRDTCGRNVLLPLEVEHLSDGPADSSEILHSSKIVDEKCAGSSLINEQGQDLQPEEYNKHSITQAEEGNGIIKKENRNLDILKEENKCVQSPSHEETTPINSDNIDSLSSQDRKIDRNEYKDEVTTNEVLTREADIKSSVDEKPKKEVILSKTSDSHGTNVEKEKTSKDSTIVSVHGSQNMVTHTKKNRKGSRKDNNQRHARENISLRKDIEEETKKESSIKPSEEVRKKSEVEKKESSKELNNRHACKKEEKEVIVRRDGSCKRKDDENNDEREDIKKRAVVKDNKKDTSKESVKREQEAERSVKKVDRKKSEKFGRTENKKEYKKAESKKEQEIEILEKNVEVALEPVDIKTLILPQEDTTESECESEKTYLKEGYRECSTQKDSRKSHVDIQQVPSKGAKINIHLVRAETPSTEEEKTSDVESAKSSIRKRVALATVDSIPGSPVFNTAEDEREYKAWKKSIMLVYGRLATHKYASLFLRPITDDQAPGYSTIVHRPMDLLMVKKNIETGMIRTTSEFQRDVLLMFQNAMMYNKSNHFVHKMAQLMQQEGLQHVQDFLTTQMLVQVVGEVPLRRETRTTDANKSRDVVGGQEETESGGKRKRLSGPEKESHKKKKV